MAMKTARKRKDPGALTPRENELMKVIARGATPQEASEMVRLSIGTVNTYLKRIYTKLGARTIREAVVAFHGNRALTNAEHEALAQRFYTALKGLGRDTKLDLTHRILGLVENDRYASRRAERARNPPTTTTIVMDEEERLEGEADLARQDEERERLARAN